MSAETDIAAAICEVILGLDMTPRSLLAVEAAAGQLYADVADASQFTQMGTATFFDASREEVGIASVDAASNRITFQVPLAETHAAGIPVATNLLDYVPNVLGPYLLKENPLIFVAPLTTSTMWMTQRGLAGPIKFQVQYNVRDEQRVATTHPNLWTKAQQHRAADALSTIIVAVARNPHLVVAAGPQAQGIGAQPSRTVADVAYGKYVSRDDVPVFAAAASITIRPPRTGT